MTVEFKLPDLGEGIHEGEIVDVFVKPGDRVAEGDPLLEVETDKAVTAIPSPFTGKVTEVRVAAGETVHVGDVMVVFEGGASDHEAAPTVPAPETVARQAVEAPVEDHPASSPVATESGRRPPVPASPATRRLARELGVDLYTVDPTGPQGLVTADDVRRHAESSPASPAAAPATVASSRPYHRPSCHRICRTFHNGGRWRSNRCDPCARPRPGRWRWPGPRFPMCRTRGRPTSARWKRSASATRL
jgi:pyruvate/2-oxoglutarate dehydrogenase complex dihydrolipoamide acyltransferase (E2) component